MMKKFCFVMLLAIGIILGSQAADMSKAEAVRVSAQELKVQEEKAEPFLAKASEYYDKGKYKKAAELQRQAVAVAPDFYPVYTDLALSYGKMSQPEEGIKLLTDAIVKRDVTDAPMFFVRGLLYEQMGDFTEAGKDYQAALNSNPDKNLVKSVKRAQQRIWSKS